jgi:hypothetical protein
MKRIDMKLFLTLIAVAGLAVCSSGCGKPTAAPTATDVKKDKESGEKGHDHAHGHDHEEVGPHDGHLIELGKEEFHLELAHDDQDKTVSLYVLDGKAEKSVPIEEKELTLNLVVDGKPAQYKLPAAPQKDDPAGKSSLFELKDAKLIEALHDEKTTARVSLNIDGKPYSGNLSHTHHH